MTPDGVVQWEGPADYGGYQEAHVRFRYKIEGLPAWTSDSTFRAAFREVMKVIDGAETEEPVRKVKLTSNGGETVGLRRASIF
ncbi:hypothetical protein [Pseudoxanthomonas sp.]|jgi:hypothetical protein|uniref:hypothetical protein n=1 Tax=Pseudoxanthomonas sp. TaxID=1871049 RepID=UPI002E106291|nr:hypothetical protein [Pseudoxanthomonas sp.]